MVYGAVVGANSKTMSCTSCVVHPFAWRCTNKRGSYISTMHYRVCVPSQLLANIFRVLALPLCCSSQPTETALALAREARRAMPGWGGSTRFNSERMMSETGGLSKGRSRSRSRSRSQSRSRRESTRRSRSRSKDRARGARR